MKKKFKGMTLVECITALAVMSVFTAAMAVGIGALGKFKVTADYVIKQNSIQAPMADNKLSGTSTDKPIIVEIYNGSYDPTKSPQGNYNANECVINHVDNGESTSSNNIIDGSGRNFRYYTKPTTPPTP